MSRSGIVNVRMVITEEKMLSNIDKIQKLINPKSKKQIVELEEDTYFKDLIESVKSYLIEYPNKKNFPASVYKASYNLVEYATNQFEENTKQIEGLIRQREANIATAGILKEALEIVTNKEEDWKEQYKKACEGLSEDIIASLDILAAGEDTNTEEYEETKKIVNAKIVNLESNLHIEIDMERIEDRSKALSYIGIEIADALKLIPTPQEKIKEVEENVVTEPQVETITDQTTENKEYVEETTFEVKPTLWQRIKQSKFVRAISYAFKVRVVLDVPALPEANNDKKN